MMIKVGCEKKFDEWSHSISRHSKLLTKEIGLGFKPVLPRLSNMINWRNLNKDSQILVINDFNMEATKFFNDKGFKNIVYLYVNNNTDSDITFTLFNIKYKSVLRLLDNEQLPWKAIIKTSDLNKEIENMPKQFDLIIANTPYGKIGADITNIIREKIDYSQFINLLPVNDYLRAKGLHHYINPNEITATRDFVSAGLAGVTTHIAEVYKNEVNQLSEDEFEIATYIDPQLNKYFKKQLLKNHYAIDTSKNYDLAEPEKYFMVGHRDINHRGLPKSKTSNTYRWNVLKNIDLEEVKKNSSNDNRYIKFNSNLEKDNLSKFLYSDMGYKFFYKVFAAANVDSKCPIDKTFPKVDWTKEWTVEEILREYDYTEEEIKEVMTDLVNYRGMDN